MLGPMGGGILNVLPPFFPRGAQYHLHAASARYPPASRQRCLGKLCTIADHRAQSVSGFLKVLLDFLKAQNYKSFSRRLCRVPPPSILSISPCTASSSAMVYL